MDQFKEWTTEVLRTRFLGTEEVFLNELSHTKKKVGNHKPDEP